MKPPAMPRDFSYQVTPYWIYKNVPLSANIKKSVNIELFKGYNFIFSGCIFLQNNIFVKFEKLSLNRPIMNNLFESKTIGEYDNYYKQALNNLYFDIPFSYGDNLSIELLSLTTQNIDFVLKFKMLPNKNTTVFGGQIKMGVL